MYVHTILGTNDDARRMGKHFVLTKLNRIKIQNSFDFSKTQFYKHEHTHTLLQIYIYLPIAPAYRSQRKNTFCIQYYNILTKIL